LTYGVWIEKEREREYQLVLSKWEAEQCEVEDSDGGEHQRGEGSRDGYGATLRAHDVEREASTKASKITKRNQRREKPKKKSAWYPLSFRSFTSLGQLVSLGLGGVGEWFVFFLVCFIIPDGLHLSSSSLIYLSTLFAVVDFLLTSFFLALIGQTASEW
jgi:hypothetical protein